MKKGFTLVELSIVLVIIGLIIGGILVGQSLIESAKINRMTSDIRQYEIAVTLFYKKYKNFPGDSPSFIPPGNGDKILSTASACAAAPNATLSGFENNQVFAQLSQAKMLNKTYLPYSPLSCGGTNDNDFELAVVTPYTELDGKAATLTGNKREPIFTDKQAGNNFNFQFYVNPNILISLEQKFTLVPGPPYTGGPYVGLTSASGNGKCFSDSFGNVPCTDPTAALGNLYYYMSPPY